MDRKSLTATVLDIIDDDTLLHTLVHSLETDPTVSIDQYDTVTVFEPRDDNHLIAYDAEQSRFLDEQEYKQSLAYALHTVNDPDLFEQQLQAVEHHVADRDTLNHFHYASRGTNNVPSVVGIAADGEGFTLGRVSNHEIDDEQYVLVKSQYDQDASMGVQRDATETHQFSREDIPSENIYHKYRKKFSRDILREFADKPLEACAAFEDAYLLEPTTPL